jgi:hypothetical protein
MTSTGKLSQAQVLIECLALEELFVGADGETPYATVTVDAHRETYKVVSRAFRRWLVRQFYALEQRPPSAQALTSALGVIEARAHYGGIVHDVHVRIAGRDGTVYVDLADRDRSVVEITACGWRVLDTTNAVKFRRPRGMLALPLPERGGSFKDLRAFVNVRDDEQFALVAGWLIAAARPRGPYTVLALGGQHGSAKSTTAEVLRRLIDPNAAMLRAEPRDVRDVMIAATHGWVIALDNLSGLEAWLSDALCRVSSGAGFATRELFTDTDETILAAQRPVIVNGIEEVITRSDLLDRALLLDLPAIEETCRRPARDFWAEFGATTPRLLGALLDAVAVSLAREGSVKPSRMPRMADFAIIVTAAAPALGWDDEYFLDAYKANRQAAHELALEASPIAAAVRELAAVGTWSGTATELLDRLNELVKETTRATRGWPKASNTLGGALRRLAPNLKAVGVTVTFLPRQAERRLITIEKVDAKHRHDRHSDAEPPEISGVRRDESRDDRDDGDDEMQARSDEALL